MKTSKKMEKYQFYFYFSKENIPKERIEIMSDAAIAIIACLLILEITDYAPQTNPSLNEDLKKIKLEFYAFLATFAIVSTLWYVNHCLIHMFRTITTTALYIQKLFLAFCCLCPLAANMIVSFGRKDDESSNISIRYAGLIVFSASMGNFFLFLYGFLTKGKYLHHWAVFGRSLNTMSRQNKYVLFKAINVPFWSLLCTLGGKIGKCFNDIYATCTDQGKNMTKASNIPHNAHDQMKVILEIYGDDCIDFEDDEIDIGALEHEEGNYGEAHTVCIEKSFKLRHDKLKLNDASWSLIDEYFNAFLPIHSAMMDFQ